MQHIDLKTSQNVTISYELAKLGDRILALILDLLIVMVGYYLLIALIIGALELKPYGFAVAAFFFILPLTIFLGWQFLFELFNHGQSPGKRIIGLQVVRMDGEDLLPGDLLPRSLLYFVDLLASGGIVGALLITSTPFNQRLGDMIAATCVIKVKATTRFGLEDILRISSLENYEPTYPEVRQFNEQDMLLIKSVLARHQQYPNLANKALVTDTARQLAQQLNTSPPTSNPALFLQTLLKDYIVLTR
ncbi:MAG: RDD family protein [Saprospiraceae bacterium]